MRGISNDSLVQIPDLHIELAGRVRDRAQIADMAVAADPDIRAIGDTPRACRVEPFVKLACISADIGVRGPGHFQGALLGKQLLARLACAWRNKFMSHGRWYMQDGRR